MKKINKGKIFDIAVLTMMYLACTMILVIAISFFLEHKKLEGIMFTIMAFSMAIYWNYLMESLHKYTLDLSYIYWNILKGNRKERIIIKWDDRKVHKN